MQNVRPEGIRFWGGECVRLLHDHPDYDLRAGDCGLVWAAYNTEPPMYEATFYRRSGTSKEMIFEEEDVEEVRLEDTPFPEKITELVRSLDALDASLRNKTMHPTPDGLPGTTLLATPRGPVALAALHAGDAVYALDPALGLRVTRVVRTTPQPSQPVLRIETAGRSVEAAAGQEVLTVAGKGKRGGALVWKAAGALSPGDVVVCAQGYGADDGPHDAELARAIGAFLGMGYVEDGRAGATVGDHGDAHTALYCALFGRVFPRANWSYGPGQVGGISCRDAAVCQELEALGFVGEMAQRRVPRWAFSLSRAGKRALLAGFMDACGRMERDGVGKMTAPLMPLLVPELRELALCAGLEVSAMRRKTPRDAALSGTAFALLPASSMAALPCWDAVKQVAVTAPVAPGLGPDKLGGVVLPAGAFAEKVRGVEALPEVAVWALTVEDSAEGVVASGVVLRHAEG